MKSFEILSHEVEYGIYEGEVLLALEIKPLIPLEDGTDKQVLELHFSKEERDYICSMIYNLDEFGDLSDYSMYYVLTKDNKVLINEYISQKCLGFNAL